MVKINNNIKEGTTPFTTNWMRHKKWKIHEETGISRITKSKGVFTIK